MTTDIKPTNGEIMQHMRDAAGIKFIKSFLEGHKMTTGAKATLIMHLIESDALLNDLCQFHPTEQ